MTPELEARNGRPFNRAMAEALRSHREDVATLEAAEAAAVSQVIDALQIIGTPYAGEKLARALIQHADTVRDILNPFDSGVRPLVAAAPPVVAPLPMYPPGVPFPPPMFPAAAPAQPFDPYGKRIFTDPVDVAPPPATSWPDAS